MEARLLQFSEATGIRDLMFSPWGWPVVESLHFIGLTLLLGTVGLFDLRLLGMAPRIPLLALHRLVPWGVAGFALNVTTGLMFVTSVPDQYLYNPAFQTKMGLMLLAGLNMMVFYAFCFGALKQETPAARTMRLGRLLAAVSLVCWLGVITGGRLITFYRPPFFWCFWCG